MCILARGCRRLTATCLLLCARARLVEDHSRARQLSGDESCPFQVERLERHALLLERREERLLPLGVLVQDDDVFHLHFGSMRSTRPPTLSVNQILPSAPNV